MEIKEQEKVGVEDWRTEFLQEGDEAGGEEEVCRQPRVVSFPGGTCDIHAGKSKHKMISSFSALFPCNSV